MLALGELGIQLFIEEETCKWKVSGEVPRGEKWNFTQVGLIPILWMQNTLAGLYSMNEVRRRRTSKKKKIIGFWIVWAGYPVLVEFSWWYSLCIAPHPPSRPRKALAWRAGPCECQEAHHQVQFPHVFGVSDHTHNEVALQQCLCSTPNDVPTLPTEQLLCLLSK